MEHITEEQISELCYNSNYKNLEILDHLKICASCQFKYDQAFALNEQLSSLEYHRPSMRFAKNIVEFIEQNTKLQKANLFWTKVISASILAAFFLILVMIIAWFVPTVGENIKTQQTVYEWNIIFLVIAVGSWLIYYLDNWLGKNRRKEV